MCRKSRDRGTVAGQRPRHGVPVLAATRRDQGATPLARPSARIVCFGSRVGSRSPSGASGARSQVAGCADHHSEARHRQRIDLTTLWTARPAPVLLPILVPKWDFARLAGCRRTWLVGWSYLQRVLTGDALRFEEVVLHCSLREDRADNGDMIGDASNLAPLSRTRRGIGGGRMSPGKTTFSELVRLGTSAQQDGARTLWVPLRNQFDRDGPDAAREYLLARRQQLVDQLEKQLDQVDGRIDG